MEKPPRNPHSKESPFYKGGLVRLRAGVGEKLLEILKGRIVAGEKYKIFHIETHEEDVDNPTVWIGPMDASPADIERFEPSIIFDEPGSVYENVCPISLSYLEPVQH